MSKKHKGSNLIFSFYCPLLDIFFTLEGYSPELQKLINELEKLKKKRKIIYSYPDFLEDVVKTYEKKGLNFLGIYTMDDLVDFLYQTFDIRKLRKPEEGINKTTLRTILYQYTGLNDVKK